MTEPKLTEAQLAALRNGVEFDTEVDVAWLPETEAVVARMVATAAQTARAKTLAGVIRVEAAIAPWPPGVRKGDVYRALDREA